MHLHVDEPNVVTNMSKIQSESNSQPNNYPILFGYSCDQYVKDTIWKQFTTFGVNLYQHIMLWPICQRYNLKAIHNLWNSSSQNEVVVTNMSKIQSESNSQQSYSVGFQFPCCDQYVKDTIWKQFTTLNLLTSIRLLLWPICQRYNLKAIHNLIIIVKICLIVVTNMSKIQSESNSQPIFECQYFH